MELSVDLGGYSRRRKAHGEGVAVQKASDPKNTAHRNTNAVTSDLCQGQARCWKKVRGFHGLRVLGRDFN